MRNSSLLTRYGQAMILGAISKGLDLHTINKALSIPPRNMRSLSDYPISNNILSQFADDVEQEKTDDFRVDLYPSAEFTPELFGRLQRNIKWLMRDEFFGLSETPCKVGVIVVMTELILGADTLGSAIHKGIRFYQTVTDDVIFTLRMDGNYTELSVELANPGLDPLNFWTEWWLLVWHRISCWLIGEKIPLVKAQFPHPPGAPLNEYNRIFSNNSLFSAGYASISFNRHYLDKHIMRTESEMEIFIAEQELSIDLIPGIDNPIALRIETQLESDFKQTMQFQAMECIANHHHMSSQTLRRRLDDEGSSFRMIKERVRRRAVMKLLNQHDMSISEIAQMTGFSDGNGLSRAIKGWTGMNPTEYREQLTNNQT